MKSAIKVGEAQAKLAADLAAKENNTLCKKALEEIAAASETAERRPRRGQ